MNNELFELSRHLIDQLQRPYRRYIMAEKDFFSARCTILMGQRGVGKTTSLIQYIQKKYPKYKTSRSCLYLPADHFLVGQTSLYEIARDFFHQGGELLCLDEVHKYSAWSRDLKSMIDTFPALKIVASGSSILHLHRGTHDLSRRVIVKKLEGLSFREFLEFRLGIKLPTLSLKKILKQHEQEAPEIIKIVGKKRRTILGEFHRYLESGFYPYFNDYSDLSTFQMTLQQGMHTTIESDLPALYPSLTGASVARIKRLLSALAETVPYTPDFTHLRKVLHISDDRTLKDYLHYLEDAGLIMMVRRAGKKFRSLEKPDRIYLGDPNQSVALAALGRADVGTLRETFFYRAVSSLHTITAAEKGDFLIDDEFTIEIGGRSKDKSQIAGQKKAYLALDDLPFSSGQRVPLWLFGFLY